MTRVREFTLSAQVPVSAVEAVDFLADLDRHRSIHPFLVSARVVDERQAPGGLETIWSVRERPRLGPIRYPIRFEARLLRPSPTALESRVEPAQGCRLVATTTAADLPDGGAEVTQHCTVSAPAWLVGYMTRGAHEAHERTYRLLPEVFAARD